MVKPTRVALLLYQIADVVAAIISWFLFFIYRKRIEFPGLPMDQILEDRQ